jgi:hypothetical protein
MHTGPHTYAARPLDYPIAVYVAADLPPVIRDSIEQPKPAAQLPAGSEVVGRNDAKGAVAATWQSVIAWSKKEARSLGGDAIVINGYGENDRQKMLTMDVVRFAEAKH